MTIGTSYFTEHINTCAHCLYLADAALSGLISRSDCEEQQDECFVDSLRDVPDTYYERDGRDDVPQGDR